MASDALKMGRGSQATVRKCIEMINRKIIAAMQYAVRFSVFDSNSTLRELTTAQSLLLSLLHGSLRQDIQFCLYIINMSSNVVQLWSSHIKVWLKDDFIFRKDDIAKAFSNLAVMMDRNSHIQLPQNIAVAFSGLINKYKLFDVFQSSGDRKAMAFVSALNSYILKITKNQEPTLQEVGAASNPSTVECSPPAAASPMVQEVNEACGHSNPTPTPSSSQEVSAASNPALQCSPPPAVSSTVQCSPSPAASPVIQEVNEACGHSNPTPTTSSSQAGRVFDRPNSKSVLALHNQAGHVFARSNSKPVLALHNKSEWPQLQYPGTSNKKMDIAPNCSRRAQKKNRERRRIHVMSVNHSQNYIPLAQSDPFLEEALYRQFLSLQQCQDDVHQFRSR